LNTPADESVLLKLPRGRKDEDQQEVVIKLAPIRERLHELEQLYREGVDASEAFTDAVKETAEASGLLAKVVRKFVIARCRDEIEERKRENEQLSFLFDDAM
jgi:hypothetical protein